MKVIAEAAHALCNELVATLKPVVAHNRRNSHDQTEGRHVKRFTDRTRNRCDVCVARGGDLHQRAGDTDNRAEQPDERRRRTHRREESKAGAELCIDRVLAAAQRAVHPFMRIKLIREVAVLCIGTKAVIDELAECRILLELARAIADVGCGPEGPHAILGLADHLLLFEQLDQHNVPRHDRHDGENDRDRPCDGAALFEHLHRAENSLGSGSAGVCGGFLKYQNIKHGGYFPL